MRYGTSYFVSIDKAAMYYRDYEGADGYAAVRRKLAEGTIHIGRPDLKPGQRLLVIDNGTRYAIEEESDGTSGQDRDSYSDTQDRDSYTCDEED